MKIAIATDTNSGITAMEGEKLGVFVLAMPVNLEETIHYEGIDITSEQLYDAMRQHRDVSTSQPSPGQLMELWDGILAKGYDEIVYIPMSSGLSGSCQSAALFAQDYDSRVQVVDNHRISVTQKESVISALRLVEQGYDAGQIRDFLEKHAYDASIYITVDSMEYLKKGGRVTPAAATLATVLNLKPVLTIQGDKLDAFAKVRGMKLAESKMIEAIHQDRAERFRTFQRRPGVPPPDRNRRNAGKRRTGRALASAGAGGISLCEGELRQPAVQHRLPLGHEFRCHRHHDGRSAAGRLKYNKAGENRPYFIITE